MDDLSIDAYCTELLTSWDDYDEYDEEEEANFDLDSNKVDELYETYSTPVDDDDDDGEMCWNSDQNDRTVVDSDDDMSSEEPGFVHQSG